MVKYNEQQITRIFHALADPTRRKIVAMVAQKEKRASELAESFQISFPAVSKHVKVLEQAQLIQRRVDGRMHRFRFNEKTMKKAYDWIAFYQRFWTERLDRLATFLEHQE